jgi:RNA polymerase sigma-70 factor (ECF subfamily)
VFLRKTHSNKTDEELVRLYQTDRNLEWLSTLFLRYATLTYGVCLKYLKDRDDAKDAVMQIHEKLIESLLQHQVKQFRPWLYVFARNHCLMHLRSQKNKASQEIPISLMENGLSGHPYEDSTLEGDIDKLERCISRLAAEQQQCVRLFFLEEQCYKDISVHTGFGLSLVKSYIQNGKRNLKICMEANE